MWPLIRFSFIFSMIELQLSIKNIGQIIFSCSKRLNLQKNLMDYLNRLNTIWHTFIRVSLGVASVAMNIKLRGGGGLDLMDPLATSLYCIYTSITAGKFSNTYLIQYENNNIPKGNSNNTFIICQLVLGQNNVESFTPTRADE